jgi:FtsZ-binding cell division protein ZapB
MMRKLITMITMCLLLVGCEEEGKLSTFPSTDLELSDSNEVESLRDENRALKEEMRTLRHEIDSLQEELRQLTQEFTYIDQHLRDVTLLEGITFEMISNRTMNHPNETVVLVHQAADHLKEPIVRKAAIIFADPVYEKVSLWTDRERAMTYMKGEYDPNETHTGWPGFDSLIGYIDNAATPPTLTLYLSRDDHMLLRFGKYQVVE